MHWCKQAVHRFAVKVPRTETTNIAFLIQSFMFAKAHFSDWFAVSCALQICCLRTGCIHTHTHERARPQYLLPATAPSFLPIGSSSSTPAQSPFAKSVVPRWRKYPILVPPIKTLSPVNTPQQHLKFSSCSSNMSKEFFSKHCHKCTSVLLVLTQLERSFDCFSCSKIGHWAARWRAFVQSGLRPRNTASFD